MYIFNSIYFDEINAKKHTNYGIFIILSKLNEDTNVFCLVEKLSFIGTIIIRYLL